MAQLDENKLHQFVGKMLGDLVHSFEAQAPQPDHHVHSLRPQSVATHIMVWLGGRVQEAEVSDKAVIPGRYGCGTARGPARWR
jgi:hypothetical protein